MSNRKASREIARDAMDAAKKAEIETEIMRTKSFDKIRPREIEWLWKNRIPAGKLTMLIGDAGVGKSLLTCHISAVLSRAGTQNHLPWPDGSRPPKGRVLFITCEDSPEDTTWARLKAAGAEMARVEVFTSMEKAETNGEWTLDKVSALEEFLERAEKDGRTFSAVIIDPISAYLPGDMQGNSDAEVRGLLRPLTELGDRWCLAIIAVKHMPKGRTLAIHSAAGSVSWTAAARMAYMVIKDKCDPKRVLFLPIKNNVSATQAGLAYQIVSTDVAAGDDLVLSTARIAWEDGEVTTTADEALAAGGSSRTGKKQEAIKFLQAELSDGPKRADHIRKRALELGITEETLKSAKRDLDIQSKKLAGVIDGPWMWSFPDE